MANIKTAVIVGGSLAGMMTALSLAKVGVAVTMLERGSRIERRGAVLSVHSGGYDQLPMAHYLRATAAGDGRGIESWRVIHKRLQQAVELDSNIQVKYDTKIQRVSQDGVHAFATTADKQRFAGDILIGADGGHSEVRRFVDPNHPDASFAGYQLWVGIVQEDELSPKIWPSRTISNFSEYDGPNEDFLFGLVVPGMNGSTAIGKRQFGLAWYDNGANELLYKSGAVEDGMVKHSLDPSSIPQIKKEELKNKAKKYFAEPFSTAVKVAFEKDYIVGTPISEYVADKLSKGRITLVGDAAHALTPMTANGFNSSLEDAATLGSLLLDDANSEKSPDEILGIYEAERLPIVTKIVRGGQSFSRSYSRK